ncbi:hypothetical protein [Fuchsiella alkaliacetigena]|uniref:hypothetical protein n=1 Tax=Fuchsiella alkaliacetigena TaxID=957042 RepID=UPI00200B4E1F|nr:hypothetical protein [Fuchsiella alkaliacetigena]MCK8825373.1 hypothetical protein [Fuchsiella alkaliacetigena]
MITRYSPKEMSIVGITVALIVVGGYILYLLSNFIPIPAVKPILMAPFLGFAMVIPIFKVRKFGMITVISAIFGLVMSLLSILLTFAIIGAGVLSDLINFLLFRNYSKDRNIIFSIALFPVACSLSFFLIFGLSIEVDILTIVFLLFIYVLGFLGAYAGYKIGTSRKIIKST